MTWNLQSMLIHVLYMWWGNAVQWYELIIQLGLCLARSIFTMIVSHKTKSPS
ncbi:hypothetical protein P692DRAFT_20824575 [Suillus brevipes Sb2]|nr:hypothetical protein P692DRAFT_20824575 [Suillus brevipes Sb2]